MHPLMSVEFISALEFDQNWFAPVLFSVMVLMLCAVLNATSSVVVPSPLLQAIWNCGVIVCVEVVSVEAMNALMEGLVLESQSSGISESKYAKLPAENAYTQLTVLLPFLFVTVGAFEA